MRRAFAVAVAAFGIAACGTARPVVEPTPAPDAQPAAPPPNAAFLPANTHLNVKLDADLNAETAQVGDVFTVTVLEPLIAQNNATVVPENTVITGLITGVVRATGLDDQAAIRLNTVRMNLRGVSHPLSASVVRTELSPTPAAEPAADDDADDAATDALAAAALGTVITGELRIAMIAALGPGAGTIVSLGTGESAAVLPAGTQMTIRTRDRIDLRN
jgi:hypothetical protein